MRTESFTEQMASWQLPLTEFNLVSDIAVSGSLLLKLFILPNLASSDSFHSFVGTTTKSLHVSTVNPIGLYEIVPDHRTCSAVDLYPMFPSPRGARVKMAPLQNGQLIVQEEVVNNTSVLLFRIPGISIYKHL